MPGSRRVDCFRVPPVDGKIGISTSNHEPVDGVGGNESPDFTSELLEHCHGLCSNSGSCLRTLPDAVFLYTELLDFQIKRRPWNSKLGSCTIWPATFPGRPARSQAVRQGGRAPSIRVPFRVQSYVRHDHGLRGRAASVQGPPSRSTVCLETGRCRYEEC